MSFVIGADPGKRQDFTAVVIVERVKTQSPEAEPADTWRTPYRVPTPETRFICRELGRLPLGTSHEASARSIASVVHNVNCYDPDHTPQLVVDATGIGEPILDSMEQYLPTNVTATRVWWTSGEKMRRQGRQLMVGKAWLVSRLQALVDTHRIEVPDTPQATQLLNELMSYEIKVTDSGTMIAGARSGAHDDLAMALALCVLEDDSPAPKACPPLMYQEDDWTSLHHHSDLW